MEMILRTRAGGHVYASVCKLENKRQATRACDSDKPDSVVLHTRRGDFGAPRELGYIFPRNDHSPARLDNVGACPLDPRNAGKSKFNSDFAKLRIFSPWNNPRPRPSSSTLNCTNLCA